MLIWTISSPLRCQRSRSSFSACSVGRPKSAAQTPTATTFLPSSNLSWFLAMSVSGTGTWRQRSLAGGVKSAES